MLPAEEPPLSTENVKTKRTWGNVGLDKLKQLAQHSKSKNHLNKANQFLAYWSGLTNRDALTKTTSKVVTCIKSAKNFIIDQRLVPHFVIVLLGLGVALCNVIVARGADNLFGLIPADPSSQIVISTNIDKYTPLIMSDATAVEKLVTTSTDSATGDFALSTRSASTEVTAREVVTASTPETGPRTKNISYTVASGDTLSGLSMRFNVKQTSIKFANNISNADLIKPGDVLKIPPDGWEPTASQIAAKNKTTASAASSTTSTKSTKVNAAPGRVNNGYPYGWCTYYVATRRAVPTSWGNAGQWLNSAKRAGYSTGSKPVAGAIMVTRESWWGHVAYVESVNGNSFTVAEMNYAGWGVTSRRTVSANDSVIKGFVY